MMSVKPGLDREGIAARVARDLPDGAVVNLGIGIPLQVPAHLPDGVEVILHAENGVLGVGPMPAPDDVDWDLTDAGKRPITINPGGAIIDSSVSFSLVRGGRLDVTVLGAFQVAANGDVANWTVPGRNPMVGGAMDLVAGAKEVWVAMEHTTPKGEPKIVAECTLPLTGHRCVTRIYTDLAVFHLRAGHLYLIECAPGVSPEQVRDRTGAPYTAELPA